MDAKEIKALLKKAREAINDKEYKSALKHCKEVLKSDKSNYNAWVFVGAAAQELNQPEQSEAAFKRAIEISPDQILAWQGLCSYYEKIQDKHGIDLAAVYFKLLELYEVNVDKKLEVCEKLIDLTKSLGDRRQLIKALKCKLDTIKGNNKDEEYSIQKNMFEELAGHSNLTEDEEILQAEILQSLVVHDTFSEDDCRRIISTCVEVMFQKGKGKQALKLADIIYQVHCDSVACTEFIFRASMDMYIENGFVMEGIQQISHKLSDYKTLEGISSIFQGFVMFLSKNYAPAIETLNYGLKKNDFSIQGWYFLAKSQLQLHQYTQTEKSARMGIEISMKTKASSHVIGQFYLLLGKALSMKKNWDSAVKAIEKSVGYLGRTKEILTAFCFTLLNIEQIDTAESICKELRNEFGEDAEVLQLEGYSLLLQKQYDEALKKLRQSVATCEMLFTLHLIGVILWEIDQRDKAFKVFVKAAELDPYFAKNFLYLGHYYNYLQDKNKACVCYQKAFTLDNTDIECGMSLSMTLKNLGEEEENMRVLQVITQNSSLGHCRWAWMQLGQYQLEKNLLTESIFSLQNALRADPNSSQAWECLGDAYLKRGSYESALKAFEKAYELNPKAMYPLYQISAIQKMRGFYVEAIEKYKNLLEISPLYIPALIGLSETLVLHAKKSFSDCLYGIVKDSCQEALHILARVAKLNAGLSCLWKLAGDACCITFSLDAAWFPLEVPSELHQSSSSETVSCQKSEMISYGSRFYGHALTIKPNISTLWHDLGVSYYLQSQVSQQLEFAKKAFICFQKAISLCPTNDCHWSALGVVATSKVMRDYAVGQHAFIKSIEIKRSNAEAWTNLGTLYLETGNSELAHHAFKIAQSSEPTYPLCWIGQAFIAEDVKHVETMDLFRHAITIGSHTEALLGYSRSICSVLLNTANKNTEWYKYDIEQMNAIVVGLDCALKYTGNNNNCPEAYNILGMLLERQGIYNASLKAYEKSLKLLELANRTQEIEIVRANYARLLSTSGQFQRAVKEFLLLKKIDMPLLCSFAHALYKANQYEQSLKLFEKAFNMCTTECAKSHIKVAMAMVANKLTGKDGPKALTLLFESSGIKPVSVPGLLALYAIGILQNEQRLAVAAQKELVPYRYHKEYCSSIAFLYAAHAYLMKGSRMGRNELLKSVHCLPNISTLWLQAASLMLQWDREYASAAATFTKTGVFHGGDKEFASQIFALSQISIGYRRGALSAAQKAVHINPAKLSNWTTLAAACHVAGKDRTLTGALYSFAKKLALQQNINYELNGWLLVMEIFSFINSENITLAASLLSQAESKDCFTGDIKSVIQILKATTTVLTGGKNLEPLFIAVKENSKIFTGWHILCQLLLRFGNYEESEKVISQFVSVVQTLFPKWASFPLLLLAVLSLRASHEMKDSDREKWLKLGVDSCSKAVHISPSNQAALFLHGLFAIESGKTSIARKSFGRVISSGCIKETRWMEKIAENLLASLTVNKKDSKDVS